DLPLSDFRQVILDSTAIGLRIASLFGATEQRNGDDNAVRFYVVLADDKQARLRLASAAVPDGGFDSLTPRCTQAHLFEREIAEQFGVVPHGHPWLKPVRFHRSYRPGRDAWGRAEGESP